MISLTAALWVAATALAAFAAAVVSKRFDPHAGPFGVVHVVVIAWSWVVAVTVVLSAGRLVSGPGLLLGVSAVALSALGWCGRRSWAGPLAANPRPGARSTRRDRGLTVVWVVLMTFWACQVVTQGLLQFITDYDSTMYHIALVDYWLQAGSLYAPDSTHWSNPANNELLGLWAVGAFPGDFLITLNNIPATLLLAFGSLELGRLLGLAPVLRNLAAFAVVWNVAVLKQLIDAENDVAVAGLFVACACYGFRYARRGRRADLALGAMCFGLLCGLKYYALGYAAVVWAASVLLAARHRGPTAGLRAGCVWLGGAVLFGGFWYARNAAVSGSPLHPLGLSEGVGYPDMWGSSFAGNGRAEIWPLAVRAVWRMCGPYPLLAVLALPAVAPWLALSGARRSRPARDRWGRLTLLLLLVASGGVLMVTPLALEDVPGSLNHLRWAYTPVRYGLGFLSITVLAFTLSLQDLFGAGRPGRGRFPLVAYTPHVLLAAASVVQLAKLDTEIEVSWYAAALACPSSYFVYQSVLVPLLWESGSPRRRAYGALALGAVGAAAAVMGIGRLAESWDTNFASAYDAGYVTHIFEELASLNPRPGRICLCDYRCSPFFGARRQFRLNQPRGIPSYDWLVGHMRSRGITHVVARSQERPFTPAWDAYVDVPRWLSAHPDDFELIHDDAVFKLYRLKPGDQALRPPGEGVAAGSL